MSRCNIRAVRSLGRRPLAVTLLALAVAGVVAACGESSPSASDAATVPNPAAATDSQGALAPGTSLSVDEAIESDLDSVLAITGALVIVGESPPRLCAALAESFPPQCGAPSLIVEGLDLGSIETLQTEAGVSWAESVQLLGTVQDGVLVMGTTSN